MPRVTAAMLQRPILSEEEGQELRACSAALEAEGCRAYESYLRDNRRRLDPTYWQLHSEDTDLRIYSERREMQRGAFTSSSVNTCFGGNAEMPREVQCPYVMQSPSSSEPLALPLPTAKPATAHRLRLVGTVPGTLDDTLLGVSFRDTATLRERNAYEKDNMDDCAVLSTLDGPSAKDPFSFLGLVWKYRRVPAAGLVRSRDLVMMTHVHQSRLPTTGERIGIVIYHSVQHKALGPFLTECNVLRMQISLVVIFRQLDDHRVDVYGHYWSQPGGHLPARIALIECVRAVLAIACADGTALKRKLVSALRTPPSVRALQRSRRTSQSTTSTSSNCTRTHASSFDGLPLLATNNSALCSVCTARLTSRLFATRGSLCRLCNQRVCGKCEVTKLLVLPTADECVEVKPFQFCVACTMKVNKTPAVELVARGGSLDSLSVRAGAGATAHHHLLRQHLPER